MRPSSMLRCDLVWIFLRVSDSAGGDTRYLGLTPAQYLSIALVGVAIYFVTSYRRNRNYRTSTTL